MLKDILMEDFKQAMKEGDAIKKNTIQLMRASIMQAEKDSTSSLNNKQMEDILVKERKKRIDAIAQFEKAGRKDLIEQTNKEILYISNYLPKPMLQEDLEKIVDKTINELQADISNVGKVIRAVKEEVGNKADGGTISRIVKNKLEEKLNG